MSLLSRSSHGVLNPIVAQRSGVISYAAGRATAYATIGLLVAWGIAAAPATSRLLQTALEPFIGPLLILVGLVLLGWIPLQPQLWAGEAWRHRGPGGPRAAGRIPAGRAVRGHVLPDVRGLVLRQPAAAFHERTHPVAALRRLRARDRLPSRCVALAVPFGAQAGDPSLRGLQRWQGPLQTANAWLIVAIGVYLTLSGTLGVI